VVSAEVILKGKKWTMVIIKPSNEEKEEEIIYLTSNHITIKNDHNDELLVEEDVEKASLAFESENKLTVDELKEVNLGIVKHLHPTFINANL